jgi:hypothetical protein
VQLLFVDEPTSGLDSFSAASLIKLLKSISRSNTSVLCTIHQPSSQVFFEFDFVIFMKEGQVIYQGAKRCINIENLEYQRVTSAFCLGPVVDVVHVFSSFGYVCSQNYNPADFVMDLLQTQSLLDFTMVGVISRNDAEIRRIHDTLTGDPERGEPNPPGPLTAVGDNHDRSAVNAARSLQSSHCKQLRWLIHREFLNMIRNPIALCVRYGMAIFMNLLIGLVFFEIGDRDITDPTNFNGLFGALTIVTMSSMFQVSQPVMLAFPFERPLFLREYTNGTCKQPINILSCDAFMRSVC